MIIGIEAYRKRNYYDEVAEIFKRAEKNYYELYKNAEKESAPLYQLEELLNILRVYEYETRIITCYYDYKRLEYLDKAIQLLNITRCKSTGVILYYNEIKNLVIEIKHFEDMINKIEGV